MTAEGLWGYSEPQTLPLSPHGPFTDLGDVLVGQMDGFYGFSRFGGRTVYTPSLQTCPLYSMVLMCLFRFFDRFKTAKFRCVGEAKYLRAE